VSTGTWDWKKSGFVSNARLAVGHTRKELPILEQKHPLQNNMIVFICTIMPHVLIELADRSFSLSMEAAMKIGDGEGAADRRAETWGIDRC
jgi:hypothetical protein